LMELIRSPATKIAIITKTMAEKPRAAACNNPKVEYIRNPPLS
jgi:hypothetical protein